ncbi:hypothetical protein HY379_02340 [Candidatus Saccharibacteria bacterium]|nr:hypothetical protein [Candidatus Saccharibacteria bacterium]
MIDGSVDLLPEVRAAYEVALRRLDEALIKQAQGPALQEGYATYGNEGVRSLEQIQPLEGILPTEQIIPLRETLTTRVTTAKDFFEKYGAHTPEASEFVKRTGAALAVAEATRITPVESDAVALVSVELVPDVSWPDITQVPLAETGEGAKYNIVLRVRGNAIQVGKNGKIIPLSSRRHASQKDYSRERLDALKVLIRNQGSELTPYDIWDEIGQGKSFDRHTMTSVRTWFKKLTHKRRPLVLFNAKRGRGSRYVASPDFNLEIVEDSTTKAPETSYTLFELGDLYVAARQLEQFNPILRNSDCAEIEPRLVRSLEGYQPDYSHIKGDTQAIWESREQAFSRVEKLFDDDERFFSFLATADEKSPEYQFVEYLFGLDDDQKALVKRLMKARIERDVLSADRIRFWAVNARDRNEIIAYTEVIIREPSPLTEIFEELSPTPDGSESEEPLRAEPVSQEKVAVSGTATAAVAVKHERLTPTEREKLNHMRLETEEIAATYLTSALGGDPYKKHKRTEIQGVFAGFTTKVVREALEAGIISREQRRPTFDIKSTIQILLFNGIKTQNTYRTRKYRRLIETIIEQTISKTIGLKENGDLI